MWFCNRNTGEKNSLTELEKAERSERLEIYKLMVEMADRVSQRRQAANSFYLTINTLLITASAFTSGRDIPMRVTLMVCFAGALISALWMKAIMSYKSLNESKFYVINQMETRLAAQPYSDEWKRIDPVKNGCKHRPFHQTERLVPVVFFMIFSLQGLLTLPWIPVVNYIKFLIMER